MTGQVKPQAKKKSQAKPSTATWRKLARKLWVILEWCVGATIVLLILVVVAIGLFFPDEKLRLMLVEQIQKQTGLVVQVDSLELDVFASLVLQNVILHSPPPFLKPIAEIDRLDLHFDPFALLRNRLRIVRLQLLHPRVNLEWAKPRTDPENNLVALLQQLHTKEKRIEKKDSTPSPLVFAVDEITLEDGELTIERAHGLWCAIKGVGVSASGILGDDHNSHVQAQIHLSVPAQSNVKWQESIAIALGLDLKLDLLDQDNLDLSGDLYFASVSINQRPVPSFFGLSIAAHLDQQQDRISVQRLTLSQSQRPVWEELRSGEKKTLLLATAVVEKLRSAPKASIQVQRLSVDLGEAADMLDAGLWRDGLQGQVQLQNVDVLSEFSPEILLEANGKLTFNQVHFASAPVDVRGLEGNCSFRTQPQAKGQQIEINAHVELEQLKLSALRSENLSLDFEAKSSLRSWVNPDLDSTGIELRGQIGSIWTPDIKLSNLLVDSNVQVAGGQNRLGVLRLHGLKTRLNLQTDPLNLANIRLSRPVLESQLSASLLELGPSLTLQQLRSSTILKPGRMMAFGFAWSQPQVKLNATGKKVCLDGARPNKVRLKLIGRTGIVKKRSTEKPVVMPGVRSSHLEIKTQLGSFPVGQLPLSLALEVEDPSVFLPQQPHTFSVPKMTLGAKGDVDFKRCSVSVSALALELSSLLELTGQGVFSWLDQQIDFRFETPFHQPQKILDRLPREIRSKLPMLSGKVRLEGGIKGSLSSFVDIERSPFMAFATIHHQDLGVSFPAMGFRVVGVNGPVDLVLGKNGSGIRAQMALQVARVQSDLGPLDLSGLSLSLASSWEQGTVLSNGKLHIERFESPVFPKPILGSKLAFDWKLTDFKSLRLKRFDFSASSHGLSVSGYGRATLPALYRDSDPLSALRFSLSTQVMFEKNENVELPSGMLIRGKSQLALDLRSTQAGLMDAKGQIRFDDFGLRLGSLSLEGIIGSIPLEQQFIHRVTAAGKTVFELITRDVRNEDARSRHSRAYEQALRPLLARRLQFSIRSLRFRDLLFRNLNGFLDMKAGVMSLGSLGFSFLGGDVVADTALVFAPSAKRRLQLDAEVSGVDISQLGANLFRGTSDISGNVRASLDLNQRDLTASCNLTRIGRQTLQAFLLAMDPNEENPGVLELRSYLQRFEVSPREVELNLRHGKLGMDVRFDLGLRAATAASLISFFEGQTFRLPPLQIGSKLADYLRL